jgi:nucleoside-diphosphate-sugar epimerase
MKNSSVMIEDFEYVSSVNFIPWDKLSNKTILVTGATGLIGLNIIKSVIYASQKKELNVKVIALVRNMEKANKVFEDEIAYPGLSFILGKIKNMPDISENIDFIVHGASVTSSKSFIDEPVETITTAINGTRNILELARAKNVASVVYLSSMEVYGHPERGHTVTESEVAGFDTSNVRNCYPISKQICESMCSSYASQYGVPVKCIRLTQTFGPGVSFDDGRVFAEFMRSAINKEDIVLKTKGETERCYLYTADSVTAILTVLLNGKNKECYNAANPRTYCSILEMAEMVANDVAGGDISVKIELSDIEKLGYASTLYMMLDVTKIRSLGWAAEKDLPCMFRSMIASINN